MNRERTGWPTKICNKKVLLSLKWFNHGCHPAGETLPDTTHVYTVSVVTAMLKVGIAVVKIVQLNRFAWENGFVLTKLIQPQAIGTFYPSRGNDSAKARV